MASSHVHIYVSVPQYLSISKLVQLIKGKTLRKIQQEFPELKNVIGAAIFGRSDILSEQREMSRMR